MMTTEKIAEEQPQPQVVEQPQQGPTEQVDSGADLGARVANFEQQARALIRERPVVAVLAAVGTGYLFARLLSRVTR